MAAVSEVAALILFLGITGIRAQVDLTDFFSNCHKMEETFDNCLMDGINSLRPYYKSGLPDYKIGSLDPFFAAEVPQKRSNPFFNYKLVLRNVTESGWTLSQIMKLRTDLNKSQVVYTQFFPDKRLQGWYEIDGTFFGQRVKNQGTWNLKLFDYIQTTTLSRKPKRGARGLVPNPPLKADIRLQSCKKLELHIGNLAGGRAIVENALDWVINTAWQPGFVVLSPLINDLVSTAFTEIFNDYFRNFPLDKVFPN